MLKRHRARVGPSHGLVVGVVVAIVLSSSLLAVAQASSPWSQLRQGTAWVDSGLWDTKNPFRARLTPIAGQQASQVLAYDRQPIPELASKCDGALTIQDRSLEFDGPLSVTPATVLGGRTSSRRRSRLVTRSLSPVSVALTAGLSRHSTASNPSCSWCLSRHWR